MLNNDVSVIIRTSRINRAGNRKDGIGNPETKIIENRDYEQV